MNPEKWPNGLRVTLIVLSGFWLFTIPFMFWRRHRYSWLPYMGISSVVLVVLAIMFGSAGTPEDTQQAVTSATPTASAIPLVATPVATATATPEPSVEATPHSAAETPLATPVATAQATAEPTPEETPEPTPEPPDYAAECARAEALVHEFIKELVPEIAITPDGDCSQAQASGALPAYQRVGGHARDPQGAIWFIRHYYGDGSSDECRVWLSEAAWFGEDHMRIVWCRSAGPVTWDIR